MGIYIENYYGGWVADCGMWEKCIKTDFKTLKTIHFKIFFKQ